MNHRCLRDVAVGVLVTLAGTAWAATPVSASGHPHHSAWAQKYGAQGSDEVVGGAAISPDSSLLFIAGATSYSDFTTLAYNAATGAPVWRSQASDGFGVSDVAVSPDGSRLFVTGSGFTFSRQAAFLTVAYDTSTGAELWKRFYWGDGGYDDQYAVDVAVSPDGSRVYVSGQTCCSRGLQNYATVGYDAATGRRLWVSTFDSGNGNDMAQAMAESPDGATLYLSGYSQSPSDPNGDDFLTEAIDTSTGQLAWVARYDPGHIDIPRSIAVTPDGSRVVVTGNTEGSLGDDYATVAFDASGNQVWNARYGSPLRPQDVAHAVAISPDGSTAFVTGESPGQVNTLDWATVAYEMGTGEQLWVARVDEGAQSADNAAFAVEPSLDGRVVFVTGAAQFSDVRGLDYLTVGYDTVSGMRLGRALFLGPDQDQATHLVLAPGRVESVRDRPQRRRSGSLLCRLQLPHRGIRHGTARRPGAATQRRDAP